MIGFCKKVITIIYGIITSTGTIFFMQPVLNFYLLLLSLLHTLIQETEARSKMRKIEQNQPNKVCWTETIWYVW